VCFGFFQNVLGKCTISKYYTVFVFEEGKSRDEIQGELNSVYGEESPSAPTIKRWFNEFKGKRTSVVDMRKSGGPCEINQKFQGWRKSSKMKEERLNVIKGPLQTLLATKWNPEIMFTVCTSSLNN